MTAAQSMLVAAGLIVPLLIAIAASPKALKLLGAWAIARAVALEDARMHYAMTRETEKEVLWQQYAIGKSRKGESWKQLSR